uniref:Major facilitator superfamily (MFS) profile domain-containing protein n=1 Tax=Chrysotila carterae TaxID=13221 RepID=A0A7S4BK93_CHRCT
MAPTAQAMVCSAALLRRRHLPALRIPLEGSTRVSTNTGSICAGRLRGTSTCTMLYPHVTQSGMDAYMRVVCSQPLPSKSLSFLIPKEATPPIFLPCTARTKLLAFRGIQKAPCPTKRSISMSASSAHHEAERWLDDNDAENAPMPSRKVVMGLFGALACLIAVQATTAQALPAVLTAHLGEADRASEAIASLSALGAAAEFALLPLVGALSDAVGRRPLLLSIPAIALVMRLAVVRSPSLLVMVPTTLLVSMMINAYVLLVGVCFADIYRHDSTKLAALEGQTAAVWGAAYAVGMLGGGNLFARGFGAKALRAAYGASAVCASCALVLAWGATKETLAADARAPVSLRGSSPVGFIRLFRRGRLLRTLSTVLCLQALHDGEGDVWQVYSREMRSWGPRLSSAYGAGVGVASTVGGLLTGWSVRRIGGKAHTLVWTLATAVSNLLFMSRSTVLAMASVPFCAAEDCMSAAAMARIVQLGGSTGVGRGRVTSECHNMAACVRVAGLFLFGKLYAVGMHVGFPQLSYVCCAAAQILAAALVLTTTRADWRSKPKLRIASPLQPYQGRADAEASVASTSSPPPPSPPSSSSSP